MNLPDLSKFKYSPDLPFDRHFLEVDDCYRTPSGIDPGIITRIFPSLGFYLRMSTALGHLCVKAALNLAGDVIWVRDSVGVSKAVENSGGSIVVEGLANIKAVEGPCVFVANHMSTLETFVLPGMIHPRKEVTYVVKRILCTMPVFGPVMRSRDPVIVDRVNPRQDLEVVLTEGAKRLERGISIIIFPQSTRSMTFDREKFNSLGIKLARRANVPVIPLALKTDTWGQGKCIKDFGRFNPHLPAHFRFGAPMTVTGNGKEEHIAVCNFIESALKEWGM